MFTSTSMDLVFHALAHKTRRAVLDLLRAHPGLPVGKLATHFDCSRIAVMNHIRVLEEADLVVSEKDGRIRRLYLNVVPLQLIHERWNDAYSELWASKLTTLKYVAERRAKAKKKP